MVEDIEQQKIHVIGNRAFSGLLALVVPDSWRTRTSQRSRLWLFGERVIHQFAPGLSMLNEPRLTAAEQALVEGVPPASRAMGGLFLEAIDEVTTWPGNPPVLPKLFARLEATLRQLRTDMLGWELLLLIEPNRFHLDAAKRLEAFGVMGLDAALYRSGLLQQRVAAVCASAGIDSLDLTAMMAAEGDPASLFLGDDYVHYSPKSNELVARALASRLQTLPRRARPGAVGDPTGSGR